MLLAEVVVEEIALDLRRLSKSRNKCRLHSGFSISCDLAVKYLNFVKKFVTNLWYVHFYFGIFWPTQHHHQPPLDPRFEADVQSADILSTEETQNTKCEHRITKIWISVHSTLDLITFPRPRLVVHQTALYWGWWCRGRAGDTLCICRGAAPAPGTEPTSSCCHFIPAPHQQSSRYVDSTLPIL